jgi:hypothetical protein
MNVTAETQNEHLSEEEPATHRVASKKRLVEPMGLHATHTQLTCIIEYAATMRHLHKERHDPHRVDEAYPARSW